MADVPMQYSPELSAAVLENLQKGIERRRAQAVAQAQGSAVTRGIEGSGWEGKQVGVANMSAQDEATQAALDMAVKNADYANQQKQIQNQQAFQTSERLGSQSFTTGERGATEDWQAGQSALDRQAQIDAASTAYERQKSLDKRNNRAGMLNSGISSLGQGAGMVAGSFCFWPGALVEMEDGSMKAICRIDLGDKTKGGLVTSVRKVFSDDTMVNYHGIYVSGSHEVNEDGIWKRAEDCRDAVKMSYHSILYVLITDKHRIWIKGNKGESIEFMDEAPKDATYSIEDLNAMEVSHV